jgi:hypothetical protein
MIHSFLRLFASVLVVLCCVVASAQENHFGDWMAGNLRPGGGVYAATTGDRGHGLVEYCFTAGNCLWVLRNWNINCEDGSKTAVLVSADTRATNLEVVCTITGGETFYAFSDFDAIDNLVLSGQRLGIAFPLKGGRIQVNSFSLNGAAAAIIFMHAQALVQ